MYRPSASLRADPQRHFVSLWIQLFEVGEDDCGFSGCKDDPVLIRFASGRPLHEPVAWMGPFVMNTEGEIRQAMIDYEEGRMGSIPPEIVRA